MKRVVLAITIGSLVGLLAGWRGRIEHGFPTWAVIMNGVWWATIFSFMIYIALDPRKRKEKKYYGG